MFPAQRRWGFSLIELLVVIAIIAVLIALLLPAVQKIREAGSRTRCVNQLHNIGVALHTYHDANGTFPSALIKSSSNYYYMSWMGRILPFVEQQNTWNQAATEYQTKTSPFSPLPPHQTLGLQMNIYNCPSDLRGPQSRLVVDTDASGNVTWQGTVAFTGYLGVSGVNQTTQDGIFFTSSQVRVADILDGTANTIMVGERPPSTDLWYGWWYAGGGQPSAYDGSCDVVLGTNETRTDPSYASCDAKPAYFVYGPGKTEDQCDQFHFWSMHPGGANFVFVDGAVRFLRYSVSPRLRELATRSGGEAIDGSSF